MTLVAFWFLVLTVLWVGFFVLEGFDFGVGMLHGVVGRDEPGRRAVIGTIAPVWDGNEVWLIVAVAGTFAAFPGWYATMLSAYYPVVLVVLIGLILRSIRGPRSCLGIMLPELFDADASRFDADASRIDADASRIDTRTGRDDH